MKDIPLIEQLIISTVPLLVSILFGSVLVNSIIKRKEKRQRKINDAIKTTEEVSVLLNDALSCLFWQIRDEKFVILDDLYSAIRNAFKFRLKFRMKVNTYFVEESIWKDYDTIIREIYRLRREICSNNGTTFDEKSIRKHIQDLKRQWEITENYTIDVLNQPFNLYFEWNQIIWYKAKKFTSYLFDKSLKIK